MNETLPGIPAPHPIRDPLDRCYTPDALARAIVNGLRIDAPRKVVEPSVGGGAFVRAVRSKWPDAEIIGVDLDPGAPGLALCDTGLVGDWGGVLRHGSSCTDPLLGVDLIIGNPPFKHAQHHVKMACAYDEADVIFILPLAYLGVQSWAGTWLECPVQSVHPIWGRPWPKRIRETAVYHWPGWRPSRGSPYTAELDLPPLVWCGRS